MVIKGQKIKVSALLKLGYLISLVVLVFYVKSVLDVDSFKATEKQPAKPTVKVSKSRVKLLVDANGVVKEYDAKLTDADSVEDLLSELRDKQGFSYEVDLYTYGTEIVSVFDQEAGDKKRWAIFFTDHDNGENISKRSSAENTNTEEALTKNKIVDNSTIDQDITKDISYIKLVDNAFYTLKQVDRP